MDDQTAQRAAASAQLGRTHALQQVDNLSVLLLRTARALELSADLADAHARRHERSGRGDLAAEEQRAAARARQAAARARSRAVPVAIGSTGLSGRTSVGGAPD